MKKNLFLLFILPICLISCTGELRERLISCTGEPRERQQLMGRKNSWTTTPHRFAEYRIIELEQNGERHEYVEAHRIGADGYSLSHWEGCKYCKEAKCADTVENYNEETMQKPYQYD